MTRTTSHRLLLCAALFHLFSDVAFAGGAILCIGPNDHRAVEAEHLAEIGCQPVGASEAPSGTAVQSDQIPASGDCADRPLHSEAELVSQADTGSAISPALVVSVPFPAEKASAARLAASRGPALDPRVAQRALRTTVLLL